jgi:hypothetical protein
MAKTQKSRAIPRPSEVVKAKLTGNKLVITVQLAPQVADLLKQVEEFGKQFRQSE